MNALLKKERAVLMADDDEDDRVLTRNAFKRGELNEGLHFAANGEELMQKLRAEGQRPDLILLDLNMPRMNGMEALKEIKADPSLRDIPVVVLTTSTDPEDLHRSYRLGANSYITKPNNVEGYQHMVQSLSRYWFDTVTLPHEHP